MDELVSELYQIEKIFKDVAIQAFCKKSKKHHPFHLNIFENRDLGLSVISLKGCFYNLISIVEQDNSLLNEFRLLFNGKLIINVSMETSKSNKLRELFENQSEDEYRETIDLCKNHISNIVKLIK